MSYHFISHSFLTTPSPHPHSPITTPSKLPPRPSPHPHHATPPHPHSLTTTPPQPQHDLLHTPTTRPPPHPHSHNTTPSLPQHAPVTLHSMHKSPSDPLPYQQSTGRQDKEASTPPTHSDREGPVPVHPVEESVGFLSS
ncbi:hypothetical protein Pmani_025238 [Petrolisthes manimaculis]|uniref:Uncharacterized protein n=1 Tax=Petrolisthes manimaculis TaxID=1843537 RepID=A0AAE1P853_9EUCA|nr:hypothetical protein Pmani_025238 [Petrolisthes manimaculis]